MGFSSTSSARTKTIQSEAEVETFLKCLHSKIQESPESVIIIKRTSSEDKTFNFMVEYGLTHEYICQRILDLNVTNYSYTDKEKNTNFSGDILVFGQMFLDKGPVLEIYIKLKLNERVICLSFHPKEFDLNYPYN